MVAILAQYVVRDSQMLAQWNAVDAFVQTIKIDSSDSSFRSPPNHSLFAAN